MSKHAWTTTAFLAIGAGGERSGKLQLVAAIFAIIGSFLVAFDPLPAVAASPPSPPDDGGVIASSGADLPHDGGLPAKPGDGGVSADDSFEVLDMEAIPLSQLKSLAANAATECDCVDDFRTKECIANRESSWRQLAQVRLVRGFFKVALGKYDFDTHTFQAHLDRCSDEKTRRRRKDNLEAITGLVPDLLTPKDSSLTIEVPRCVPRDYSPEGNLDQANKVWSEPTVILKESHQGSSLGSFSMMIRDEESARFFREHNDVLDAEAIVEITNMARRDAPDESCEAARTGILRDAKACSTCSPVCSRCRDARCLNRCARCLQRFPRAHCQNQGAATPMARRYDCANRVYAAMSWVESCKPAIASAHLASCNAQRVSAEFHVVAFRVWAHWKPLENQVQSGPSFPDFLASFPRSRSQPPETFFGELQRPSGIIPYPQRCSRDDRDDLDDESVIPSDEESKMLIDDWDEIPAE